MQPRLSPRVDPIQRETQTSAPEGSSRPAPGNEAAPENRMNLLFITHSGTAAPSKDNQRAINYQAQKNAFIKRKQARQEASRKRLAVPPRLFGDFQRREPSEDAATPPAEQPWPSTTALTTSVNPIHYFQTASPRTFLDSSRVDQFETGKISMNPEMQSIFMWYFSVILPVVEPTQSERDDYSRWAVPLFTTEPALLYSLLTCMAHDIEQSSVVGFGPPARRNMATERLHYRVKAIEALNESLADPKLAAKPSTLLAVHFLLWQEIFAGDECVHLDGVQRLVELRGGYHGLQRKGLEGVMLGCFWRSIRTRTKPILSMVSDETELTAERFAQILSMCDPATARLGEGLLEPELNHYFDKEMLQLLEDARKAWVCFELIGIHIVPTEAKRQATIKRVNIDHRLLSYPFDHYSEYRPIQEAIRQALITFSSAHYCVVQPASHIARCHVEDLQAAISATDVKSCWGSADKVLLWVLFQGAHMSFGQRERPWFVAALAKVSQKLRLQNWIQVRSILVRFYYMDRVFQDSFRKIWAEVELLVGGLSDWF